MEETGKERGRATEKLQAATSVIFENKQDAQIEREGWRGAFLMQEKSTQARGTGTHRKRRTIDGNFVAHREGELALTVDRCKKLDYLRSSRYHHGN